MHNEFTVNSIYIIECNIAGDTLISWRNGEDDWDGLDASQMWRIDESACFNSKKEANTVVKELTSLFTKEDPDCELDFEVKLIYFGSMLYEKTREALAYTYGNTLRENQLDHDMAAAAMRVFQEEIMQIIQEEVR